jgi:hypothetical protein
MGQSKCIRFTTRRYNVWGRCVEPDGPRVFKEAWKIMGEDRNLLGIFERW